MNKFFVSLSLQLNCVAYLNVREHNIRLVRVKRCCRGGSILFEMLNGKHLEAKH